MKTGFLPLLLLLPSVTFADMESLLPSDLGLGVSARQSPFVGGDADVGATWTTPDREGFDIKGATWSFNKTDNRQLYVGAGLDEWDHERGDSPQLQDMNKLDRAINLKLGAAWKLPSGVVNAEVAKDVAAHEGTQAHLRYTLNSLSDTAVVRPYLEGQWLSSDMTDYYVGVDAAEVTAGRPAYQADDALALKAGVRLEKPLNARWMLIGAVDVTRYDSQITDSPIVENGTVWGGKLGLAYQWR